MHPYPSLRILSEEEALASLRDAYYELQHHELALDELWEGSDEGRRRGNEAFIERQLKEVADQADRLRSTLELVKSIRRYGHLLEPEKELR